MSAQPTAIVLADESTWSAELISELQAGHEALSGYELEEQAIFREYTAPGNKTPMALMRGNRFRDSREAAIERIAGLLLPHSLRGWHCTRLTAEEREFILQHGMQPPCKSILESRVRRLEANAAIPPDVAERLIKNNLVDEEYRRGTIWFCFFAPRLAGEGGVGDLLRNWGGEALYNLYDTDGRVGPILRSIGTPCIVEADIPIAEFSCLHTLAQNLGRRFCVNRGLQTAEPVDHEDSTTNAIGREQMKRIIVLGDPEFALLTGCDEWEERLNPAGGCNGG